MGKIFENGRKVWKIFEKPKKSSIFVGKNINSMEQRVLDKISFIPNFYYYDDCWRNGKIGAITDVEGNGIYRFIEAIRDKNGNLVKVNESDKDCPIITVGITAYWIRSRNNFNPIIRSFGGGAKRKGKDIREQFDGYTAERYKQFKENYQDNPSTWNWDWDFEFYTKYIIPHEMELNKMTEVLFDYIPDDDITLVRSLMDNYIEYLKTIRKEKGYYVSPELMVLRSLADSNEFMLEDLEDYEVNTTFDKLESEGYIKVAWVEGHHPEAVRLLDKGKVYLKQLEEKCRNKATSSKNPNRSKVKAKKRKNSSKTKATFVYKDHDADPFSKQRLDLIASNLIGQFVSSSKTTKSLIKDLFRGIEIGLNSKIIWKGTKAELVYFFRELNLKGYIICPNDEKMWVIVASHFKIKKELKKGNYTDVPISAESLQNYTAKPKDDIKRILDKIILFFEPDLKKVLELKEIDTAQEAENARHQELANRDFVRSQKK